MSTQLFSSLVNFHSPFFVINKKIVFRVSFASLGFFAFLPPSSCLLVLLLNHHPLMADPTSAALRHTVAAKQFFLREFTDMIDAVSLSLSSRVSLSRCADGVTYLVMDPSKTDPAEKIYFARREELESELDFESEISLTTTTTTTTTEAETGWRDLPLSAAIPEVRCLFTSLFDDDNAVFRNLPSVGATDLQQISRKTERKEIANMGELQKAILAVFDASIANYTQKMSLARSGDDGDEDEDGNSDNGDEPENNGDDEEIDENNNNRDGENDESDENTDSDENNHNNNRDGENDENDENADNDENNHNNNDGENSDRPKKRRRLWTRPSSVSPSSRDHSDLDEPVASPERTDNAEIPAGYGLLEFGSLAENEINKAQATALMKKTENCYRALTILHTGNSIEELMNEISGLPFLAALEGASPSEEDLPIWNMPIYALQQNARFTMGYLRNFMVRILLSIGPRDRATDISIVGREYQDAFFDANVGFLRGDLFGAPDIRERAEEAETIEGAYAIYADHFSVAILNASSRQGLTGIGTEVEIAKFWTFFEKWANFVQNFRLAIARRTVPAAGNRQTPKNASRKLLLEKLKKKKKMLRP